MTCIRFARSDMLILLWPKLTFHTFILTCSFLAWGIVFLTRSFQGNTSEEMLSEQMNAIIYQGQRHAWDGGAVSHCWTNHSNMLASTNLPPTNNYFSEANHLLLQL